MNRFDLDKALAAWRRTLEHSRTLTVEDLDELEQHVRDQVAGLVAEGLSEDAAFDRAVREMGDQGAAQSEYGKVYWGKLRRQRRRSDEIRRRFSMLKNYLTLALRMMRRHPGYAFINVFGLAVGMVCCLLVGLYIDDELSFDRFHEDADRLFAVTGGTPDGGQSLATPYSLASVLQSSLPDVELTTRVWSRERPVIREEVQLNARRQVLFAESSFFEMFTFPVVAGDAPATLTAPDGAVITETFARTFFGEEDPIGESLTLHGFRDGVHAVTVGAVVKDAPANSSFDFDLIAPLSLLGPAALQENQWGFSLFGTYVRTRSPLSEEAFTERIAEGLRPHVPADAEVSFSALPITSLHLSGLQAEGLRGQAKYLYIFGSVALFVLLIAAVNYVNLVTAQSMQRAREVGVRKTLGAGRSQLARQFLGESVLLSLFALLLALALMALALPAFNSMFEKHLTLASRAHLPALALLCGFLLLAAIAAGAYPALFVSRFQPMEVLRGAGVKTAGGGLVRQGLVVVQFAISATILIGTTIVYGQLDYIQDRNLGFNGEQVIVVDLPERMPASLRETLKERALSHPGIVRASLPGGVPSLFQMGFTRPITEVSPNAPTVEESIRFLPSVVDEDYIPMLEIAIIAGRNFSENFPADASRAYVLNRTAVERLGWSPEEAVGRPFKLGPPETPQGEIIGVVEDFHVTSLHEEIEPVVLQLHTVGPVGMIPRKLAARLAPEHLRDAMAFIEQQLSQLAPGAPFEYAFIDETFDEMYRAEERLRSAFTTFAVLAVFLACLGLFGIAAFSAERRTKEMGIRKVMGATAANIVVLLSRDFLTLVLVAFVIAAPVAYLGMRRWLEDFAYRIEISPGIFVFTGVLMLLIAAITLSYQAVRAALADPVKSLRYE